MINRTQKYSFSQISTLPPLNPAKTLLPAEFEIIS